MARPPAGSRPVRPDRPDRAASDGQVGGPLAATLGRLDAAAPHGIVRAGRPTGRGWTCVRDLLDDPAILRTWFDATAATSRGAADVAGSFLAGWLGAVLLEPPARALQTERRTWPLDPAASWVHRHDLGWLDGVAVAAPALRVLPDDVDASHADATVVADVGALRRSLADDAVRVLGPLFAAVRALAPFGVRGMWGTVADSLAATATSVALRHGWPTAPAFAGALALVEELEAAGAGPITRPTPEVLTCAAGPVTVARRGTCCLWYKTTDVQAPAGERYCLSCPLQPDPGSRARWVTWLDGQAPQG